VNKKQGFFAKYIILKFNGKPSDPDGIYFVLKINGKDKAHARASRMALKVYADEIESVNSVLHNDLYSLLLTQKEKLANGQE